MRVSRSIRVGTLALLALSVLASTGAVATGPANGGYPVSRSSSGVTGVASNTTATARLNTSVITVRQGETTSLQVRLTNTSEATIVVGGEDRDYNITITITDANGDGIVPLDFRTGSVGMMATRFRPANGVDEYGTVNAAPDPDGTVPVGDYSIAVYVGHGVSGEPTDLGTVTVLGTASPPNASIGGSESPITLHPRPEQVITGTTDLHAGRTITVRLESAGGSRSPFLMTEEVTVGGDGNFSATFDMNGIDPPANATVSVYVDGTRIAGPVPVEIVTRSARTTTNTPQTPTRPPETTTRPPQTTTPLSETTIQTTRAPGQPGFGILVALASIVGIVAGWRRYGHVIRWDYHH